MQPFVTAREALHFMQQGIELQAWYGPEGFHGFLMTRERHRLRFPSFESMQKHGWLREMPRTRDQNFGMQRFGLTEQGQRALAKATS